MARDLIRSDITIRSTKPAEKTIRLSDGDGLYLLVKPNGARWWRMDYTIFAKRKTLSVGVYPDTGLKDARAKADEARKLVAAGLDPSDVRKGKKEKLAKANEIDRRITEGLPSIDSFAEVATEWLAKKRQAWA